MHFTSNWLSSQNDSGVYGDDAAFLDGIHRSTQRPVKCGVGYPRRDGSYPIGHAYFALILTECNMDPNAYIINTQLANYQLIESWLVVLVIAIQSSAGGAP